MKKYMVADLVKDLREDSILLAMDKYKLNRSESARFVDNFPNQSTWPDVEEVVESLGIGITDVEDDDVENYMEMGRENKGEILSSISDDPIQWIYDNKLKSYIVLMYLTFKDGRRPVMYKISPEMMREWTDPNISFGEYFMENIRKNEDLEDPEISCGCGPNPCEPQQVDRFNTRFVAIS